MHQNIESQAYHAKGCVSRGDLKMLSSTSNKHSPTTSTVKKCTIRRGGNGKERERESCYVNSRLTLVACGVGNVMDLRKRRWKVRIDHCEMCTLAPQKSMVYRGCTGSRQRGDDLDIKGRWLQGQEGIGDLIATKSDEAIGAAAKVIKRSVASGEAYRVLFSCCSPSRHFETCITGYI
jgi:hypothetical protein